MIFIISATLIDGIYMPEDHEVRRTYRIGGSATLDDLCTLVLNSVDFDHDHLYEFHIGTDNIYGGQMYSFMPQNKREKNTNAKLYNIGLKKGTPFTMLYDYGDDWVFRFHVDDVLEESGNVPAQVLVSEGEVEQYPDFDELFDIGDNLDEYYDEIFDLGDDLDEYDDELFEEAEDSGASASNINLVASQFIYDYSDDIDFSDEYFDEDDEVITEDSNPRFGRMILRIVEHQIETGNPACVTDAYKALQKKGDYRKVAKVKLANALITVLFEIMKEQKDYSDSMYQEAIRKVMEKDFGNPSFAYRIETGKERKYGQILKEIDENIMFLDEEEKAALMFMNLWPSLKEWVLDNFARETESGLEVLSPLNIDDLTDMRLPLFNVLEEIDQAFLNTNRYGECLRIFPDILETFSWKHGEDAPIKGAIGESYEMLGQQKKADAWFDKWYRESKDDPECTNYYVYILMMRKDLSRAREILESHLPDKPVADPDKASLYVRAADFYRDIGDKKKSSFYNKLGQRSLKMEEKRKNDNIYDFPFGKPVVTPAKIYPNDPCPCGSGKKYKKCCGRKK